MASVDEAYLQVCRTLPAVASDLIAEGNDLRGCAYLITNAMGETVLEVPFSELSRSARQARNADRASDGVWELTSRSRAIITRTRHTLAWSADTIARSHQLIEQSRANLNALRQWTDERFRETPK